MNDPLVKKYPLLVITPPGRYRVHSLFWTNPWLRDQVYQHRIWISRHRCSEPEVLKTEIWLLLIMTGARW